MTLTILKHEALKLDKIERLIFAQFMIDSILKEDKEDFELSVSDLEKLDKRVERFRSDNTKGVTWETVKKNMLAKKK